MRASAAAHERALSQRIRSTWRLRAVDDDLRAALGRRVLIAGRDLRNFGMELKHVDAGPLDLNDRQFDVLRRSRQDTPPFVFQFTAPPEYPWCFRIWALREDSLDALRRRSFVTASERDTEAFTMALTMGASFATTEVTAASYRRTGKRNEYPGRCVECGGPVERRRGVCLLPTGGGPWAVVHQACSARNVSTVEITLDEGEPAHYLSHFSDDLVPEDAWPEVTPPRDYAEPPLRPAHLFSAARYLELAGVLHRAPGRRIPRAGLTLVRQRTPAAEIAERVLRRIRADRALDGAQAGATPDAAVGDAIRQIELRTVERVFSSPWVDEASRQRLKAYAVGHQPIGEVARDPEEAGSLLDGQGQAFGFHDCLRHVGSCHHP